MNRAALRSVSPLMVLFMIWPMHMPRQITW